MSGSGPNDGPDPPPVEAGGRGALEADGRTAFEALYGRPPLRVAHAPGRVNLVGEHIDYCGLAVLPMAIDRRITLLFRPRADATVRIASRAAGPEAAPRAFRIAADIPPYPAGDWGNYPKAAARVVARGYGGGGTGRGGAGRCRGIDALVVSDLLPAAGLASSSALVVACALALLDAAGIAVSDLDRRQLARRLAAGERYVGTAGGGMDQAVCLLAEEGHALRVAFDPLRTASVPVPAGWRFLVAYGLEPARKSGAARETYNRRRRECEEALAILERRATDGVAPVGASTGEDERADAGADADAERERATTAEPPVTYARLLSTLGPSALLARAAELPPPLDRRFRHAVTEAVRVDEAERALRGADLEAFGAVLLDAHRSLREDYEVSTPALDRLVGSATERGAAGACLTGAGLGGCVVAVCDARREAALRAGLRRDFYGERSHEGPPDGHLFTVRPSAGARLGPPSPG